MSSSPKRSDSMWSLFNYNLTLCFSSPHPPPPLSYAADLMNEWSSPNKDETIGMEELFQHSNKQLKIHRSPSSCLTCFLLPLRQVTCHTYFVEVQKTTAAANNREEMRFSLFKQNLCCSRSQKWKSTEECRWCESMNLINSPNEPAPFYSWS